MSFKVKTANPPEPEPCPNCGHSTTVHFTLVYSKYSEQMVCEKCLSDEIISRNDGLYGMHEWHAEDRPRLTSKQIIQIIETQFVRGAKTVRIDYAYGSKLAKEHRDQIESLLNRGKLEETTAGVDDGKAVMPSYSRQRVLIEQHDLLSTWDTEHDVSFQRINKIRNRVEEELDVSLVQ